MSFNWTSDCNDSVISMEDITDRVEELRGERDSAAQDYLDYREAKGGEAEWEEGEAKWADDNPEDAKELAVLEKLVGELCGNGGDYQWEGDWYPQFLIQNTHFSTYARELAGELYDTELRAAKWPFSHIDWEDAADALRQDYSSVDMESPEEGEAVLSFLYR